jgi:hypothetical protein
MLIALLWLASAILLVDEVFEIPAGDWRYVEVDTSHAQERITCSFRVQTAAGRVRAVLLAEEDLPQFRSGQSHNPVAASGPGPNGAFSVRPPEPGRYVLAIDNRGQPAPVEVLLHVAIEWGGSRPQVRYADPVRRIVVIAAGFAVFFGVAFWSARKLLAARRG